MKPLYIYITRHGQTQHNINERVQGWNDSPLTDLGIYQAKCTGIGLKDVTFVKAYSSDLARQYDTAQTILQQNNHPDVPIIEDIRLREMCYGRFQAGPTINMLKPIFDKYNVEFPQYEILKNYITAHQISDFLSHMDSTIETVDSVQKRMLEALNHIVEDNADGGNVLVASSSCAIDDLFHYLFPANQYGWLVDNCCICLLRYQDGKFYQEAYDDISYRQKGEALCTK